jgi:uncharacterized membrane protein
MGAESRPEELDALPFVAPCRTLALNAPFGWLARGVADFVRAWPQSLCYGVFMAAAMAVVRWLAWRYGSYWFMLAMLGGFVFLAPLTCSASRSASRSRSSGSP